MIYPVRMIHEEHGATHAYNGAEVEWHKQRGWQVEKVEEKDEPKKVGRPKKAEA